MLLWRPAPAGCTISASSPQQQQIWVVVPGDHREHSVQYQVSATISTSHRPICPRPALSSQSRLRARQNTASCSSAAWLAAAGGLLQRCSTAPAPHQPRQSLVRSYSLQSTVYSLQSTATPLHTSCSQSTHRDQHTGAMVDISPDTASTVQEAADKVTICGIVRL